MTANNGNCGALHAWVSGRVQGVGFRYSALREAERCGLTGWVRNTMNGEVEVWVEGHPDKLAEFSAWLHKGPRSSRVDSVTKDNVEPQGYTDIRVKY